MGKIEKYKGRDLDQVFLENKIIRRQFDFFHPFNLHKKQD